MNDKLKIRFMLLVCRFIYANSRPHRLDLAMEAKTMEGILESTLEHTQ